MCRFLFVFSLWHALYPEIYEHLLSVISNHFFRPDVPTDLFVSSVSFAEGTVRAIPPKSAFCFKLIVNYNFD